ncbi:MAG: acyltransferase [Prevotellaceae bacterium]|nr:acyltransferase [Candidatus Minthosoma caballi]
MNLIKMKERNQTFDFLCGICIIRMILLHTITFCGHKGDEWWTEIMSWSFFFMCFFFFKAGYFNKTVSGDTKAYIKDKAKRLLIPYVTWGLIGFLIYAFYIPFEIKRYGHPIEEMEWSHLWKTSSFWGNEPVWFLFSFFFAYVLVHFIKKIHIIKPISVFQTVVVLACPFVSYWLYTLDNPLPLSLSNIFMGVFFFHLGRTWRWIIERMGRRNTLIICSVLIVVFVVLNIVWHGEYIMSTNRFTDNPWAAFFNTMIILIGLSGLLIKLPLGRVPVVSYIGQHSMVYFVAHYPILQFYRFTHIVFGHSIYGHYDDFIVLPVFVFCICTWLVPYVEGVPFLSGRFKK